MSNEKKQTEYNRYHYPKQNFRILFSLIIYDTQQLTCKKDNNVRINRGTQEGKSSNKINKITREKK